MGINKATTNCLESLQVSRGRRTKTIREVRSTLALWIFHNRSRGGQKEERKLLFSAASIFLQACGEAQTSEERRKMTSNPETWLTFFSTLLLFAPLQQRHASFD
ncbi:uncharacterized protein LOC143823956 [Paroedura picta]|uniref:uncharacterized protein LOC143823956 n=1 Tax=Paroedura picta TaxID=143630 RepID=UPI004056D1DA